jgi:hypothetical protein
MGSSRQSAFQAGCRALESRLPLHVRSWRSKEAMPRKIRQLKRELSQVGFVVRIEIDGIGAIENPVIEEPSDNVRIEER